MKKTLSMIGTTHFWWHVLPVIGILLWGALSFSNNLWYDEAYSAALIAQPIKELIYITSKDVHSPFYYLILKGFYSMFGGSHFWILKLFSQIFMIGYLLVGKVWVKKLFGEKISVYFMLFSIAIPIMSIQGSNVRMYSMALFCMNVVYLSICDILTNPEEKKRKMWVILCIASVCSVYCHIFSLIQTFVLYLLFFMLIIVRKQFKLLKRYFISSFVILILYFPWLIVTYLQMVNRVAGGGSNSEGQQNLYNLINYCVEWFSSLDMPITSVMYIWMGITICLGYLAVDWYREHKESTFFIGVGAVGITTLIGALVSAYITPCFLGRYVFPGFGGLCLMYAIGFEQLASKKIKTVIVALLLFCFVLQYREEVRLEYDSELELYQEYVENNIGQEDAIMGPSVHTVFLSVYYPDLQYFLYGYMDESVPFANTQAFSAWEQLEDVEGNLWYICFEEDSPYLLGEKYTYEDVLHFHHMYYDFVLYKLNAIS